MSISKYVKQLRPRQECIVTPTDKIQKVLKEAPELSGSEDNFATELVSFIDDSVGGIDGEVVKDERPNKNTGKKIGVYITLPADKRIPYVQYAKKIIESDPDLEEVTVSDTRRTKDFAFQHKDMNKYVYVNTRPDGKRGGGVTADPNELMTAALCTLSKIPKVETIEDLDALINQVKEITRSGKIIGFTALEVEALEQNYTNLIQAISAAEVIMKRGYKSADKVYLTGKSWDDDVKQFQVTKFGMRDFNASDFIIKKGKNFIGISLKKKESANIPDPTLINKSFSSMIQGKEFDAVRNELDIASGEFYTRVIQVLHRFQKARPKQAVDKDGIPFLSDSMMKDLGPNAKGVNNKNWKKFVQRIPNAIINLQLKKSKSLFKPIADVIIKNSDLFGNQLLQLIFKTDLKELQKVNFDFALVTGVGRYLPTRGPVIEEGEYKDIDTMTTKLNDLFKSGKVQMVLNDKKTQAFERGATSASLAFILKVGSTPICEVQMRYKGNFRAAPNFLAQMTPEFKGLLK